MPDAFSSIAFPPQLSLLTTKHLLPSRPSPSCASRPASWFSHGEDRRFVPHPKHNRILFKLFNATPRRPPQQLELVSPIPISKTIASSACQRIRTDQDGYLQLIKPAPISKHQPTWDPYTATPLVEEQGFELNTARKAHPSTSPFVSLRRRILVMHQN